MYNAENTIIKCLDSVVNQLPIDDFEIVIVDDGSKDSSLNIVKKYASRSIYDINIITQHNQGVSSARNKAIKHSKYNLIALIDSDDIWLPGKLKDQINAMKEFDADFVGTLHNNLELGFPYKLVGRIYTVTLHKMLIKMAPSTITALFKKSLIEKAGYYDEEQKYAEDGNLWLRFSKFGKMIILNKNYAIAGDFKPLYGHSGLSGNLKGMFEGELKNLKDLYNLKMINFAQYLSYKIYFTLKYKRRVFIVKNRRK